VTTKNAILRGRKPDLRNRFVRGTEDYRSFVPEAFVGGAIARLENDSAEVIVTINPASFPLAANHLPVHNHTIEMMPHKIVTANPGAPLNAGNPASIAHQHTIGLANVANSTAGGGDSHVEVSGSSTLSTATWPATGDAVIENHPRTTTMAPMIGASPMPPLGSQQAVTHTHTATTAQVSLGERENRPPFLDMIFILRVK
jgi:hypothetical protein